MITRQCELHNVMQPGVVLTYLNHRKLILELADVKIVLMYGSPENASWQIRANTYAPNFHLHNAKKKKHESCRGLSELEDFSFSATELNQ